MEHGVYWKHYMGAAYNNNEAAFPATIETTMRTLDKYL